MSYTFYEIFQPHKKSLLTHLFIWIIYITYEIYITAYVAHVRAHPLDYLLHYLAYIAFFYLHSYILFLTIRPGRIYYFKLICGLAAEIFILYSANSLIYYFLQALHIPTIASSPWLLQSFMASIYRAVLLMILSSAYFLSIFSLIQQKQKLMADREAQSLRADLALAELAFLKAQIKPHFLFNQLSEIYQDVKAMSKVIADKVLAMAELMQYAIVADSANVKIPIVKELDYIKHYLFLQQLKYPGQINFKLESDEQESSELSCIIPLVLITLVENVFEHADLSENSSASIYININKSRLTLKTANKRALGHTSKGAGIGLSNLENRLAYYYKDKYQFIQHVESDHYSAKLILHLN